MWMPLRSFAVLALLSSSVLACGAAAGDADQTDSAFTGTCGSPDGTEIAISAANGRSTLEGPLDSRANRVYGGPYVDGRAIGDAVFDLVSHAKREVIVEMYEINERSWLAGRLKDAIARLPPDVPVYVLTNPMLGRGALGLLPESRDANAERVSRFLASPNVHAAAWQADDFLHFNALHTKLVVVDGARALVTDANLQPQGDPLGEGLDHDGQNWYQLAVGVEGEIASAIRRDAVAAWTRAAPKDPLPEAPPVFRAPSCTHMIALGREAGDHDAPSANFGYAAMFMTAEKSVRVLTPNLNDDDAVHALAVATESADVYLVLSQHFDDKDNSVPGWGGNNEVGLRKLTDAAKNPCRLHVRWFAREQGVAIQGNVDLASHAKWASADGDVMILGSQNLDVQSWRRSREFDVAIDDPETTRKFDAIFDETWAKSPQAFECR
jgi:phosphatidylserine/phosphatidylglycerophosphate/cardiolipin synthase-like enzyme